MNSKSFLKCSFIFCIPTAQLANASVIGTQVEALAVAIQSNSRLVISGMANTCDTNQLLAARFGTDGTLDGSFNGNGYILTQFGSSAFGKAVVVQPTDQKIVVAGNSDDSVGVVRYTTGGTLDTTFGSNGRFNFNLGLFETANAAMMQSSKILIAGSADVGGETQFFVARINTNGALDVGFGTSGITVTPIGDGDSANAMSAQSNGKIILAGTAVISGQPNFAVARYSTSGILDTTFGVGGIATTAINFSATGNAVAVDANNKIIVAGSTSSLSGQIVAVARYTSNGTLDGTFGTSGVVQYSIPSYTTARAFGVAVQADGNIVLCGNADNDVLVMRLDGTDGSLDTTFGGGNGYVTTTIGTVNRATSILVQPADQMIVIAGISDLSGFIARYDTVGDLDTTFGDLGTGWNIDLQGEPGAPCGVCTNCPTGTTGSTGQTGATGPTGIATLGAYGAFYNTGLSLGVSGAGAVAVPFPNNGPISNLTYLTDTITFALDGIYSVNYVVDATTSTNVASAFSVQLNGIDIPGTTFNLPSLAVNDQSANGQMLFTANSGDNVQLVYSADDTINLSGLATLVFERIA